MSTLPPAKRIAVVVGSTRTIRVGPAISDLIFKHLSAQLAASTTKEKPTLHLLDLADYPLPLFDEPGIPSQIRDPTKYAHEHTRKWSATISGFDAFVFVTPQYNWNIPAALKNALDFLFHEWAEKPALVVSYGGHGGDKAAAVLVQTLQGLNVKVNDETVNLYLTPRERLLLAATQGVLLEGTEEYWADELKKAKALFDKLLESL